MVIKKSLLAASGVALMGIASLGVIGTVAADSKSQSGLAEKIAHKFNINQDEVQNVLNEHHEQMHQDRQEMIEQKLSNAVKEGSITEDQKSVILEKFKQLHEEREADKENSKEMSHEDRKNLMKEKKHELKAWAEENGIPEDFLKDLFPNRHGHGGPRIKG